MVALEGSTLQGKTIGCNDILVPISKNVLIEKNEVESAMNELFAAKSTDKLINFIKGQGVISLSGNIIQWNCRNLFKR